MAIFYIVIAFIWISIVIYSSYFVPTLDDQNMNLFTSPKQIYFRYGFDQLHMTNPFFIVVFIGFIYSLILLFNKTQVFRQIIEKYYKKYHPKKWVTRLLITLICTLLLWALRSNFENTDFLFNKIRFPEDMAFGLIHVRFDEMWESYIHFESYKLFQSSFGLSINKTYQLISVISGSLFIYMALVLSHELNPKKPYKFMMKMKI